MILSADMLIARKNVRLTSCLRSRDFPLIGESGEEHAFSRRKTCEFKAAFIISDHGGHEIGLVAKTQRRLKITIFHMV
jgi:hypothetical protein